MLYSFFFKYLPLSFNSSLLFLKLLLLNRSVNLNFKGFLEMPLAYDSVRIRGFLKDLSLGKSIRFLGKVDFIFGITKGGGVLRIGDRVCAEDGVTLSPRDGSIFIGDDVFIGPSALIQSYQGALINIKNNVLIAKDVCIYSSNHRIEFPGSGYSDEVGFDINIDEHVWIGAGVKVLCGVNIGKYSVIAAGSIVRSDVDPYSIYAGVPAKKIKEFDRYKNQWVDVRLHCNGNYS